MSASTGVAPARRMQLTEAKKLNGVVTTVIPVANSGRRQRQPQGVSARRAAQRVPHAQLLLRGALKGRHVLAKNELLRLQNPPERLRQFLVNRTVLAFQVQHRHGRRCGAGRGCRITRRNSSVLHILMLSANLADSVPHRTQPIPPSKCHGG